MKEHKRKLTQLAEQEYETEFEKVLEYAKLKAPEHLTGAGRNTWITPEGKDILDMEFIAPELTPDIIDIKCLKHCSNKRYVKCQVLTKPYPVSTVYVLFGHMDSKRCIGKRLKAEVIQSTDGVTYRHVRPKFFDSI